MKNPSSRILYARITETSGAKDVYSDVFGGFTSDRIGNVYMSKGNAVTVQFLPSMNNNHFLLHYNGKCIWGIFIPIKELLDLDILFLYMNYALIDIRLIICLKHLQT